MARHVWCSLLTALATQLVSQVLSESAPLPDASCFVPYWPAISGCEYNRSHPLYTYDASQARCVQVWQHTCLNQVNMFDRIELCQDKCAKLLGDAVSRPNQTEAKQIDDADGIDGRAFAKRHVPCGSNVDVVGGALICDTTGYYNLVQCDAAQRNCWCVNPVTAAVYPGTTFSVASQSIASVNCPRCGVMVASLLQAGRVSDALNAQHGACPLLAQPVLVGIPVMQVQTCANLLVSWSEWGQCTRTCGQGSQTRSRVALQPTTASLALCPILSETETRSCYQQECVVPIDCVVGEWSSWTGCSRSCGPGQRVRNRIIERQAAYGGQACPATDHVQDCTVKPDCSVNCIVSAWTAWTECSRSCDGGQRSRSRYIERHPTVNGLQCGSLAESVSCNSHPCPVDCVVGSWFEWSACSQSCGQGSRQRQRPVNQAQRDGGRSCPPTSEAQFCNKHHCPIDCQVSNWSEYSDCSVSCGAGTRHRTRQVVRNPQSGGAECPPRKETTACNNGACPVNCIMTAWTLWSGCSASCASGYQSRFRNVIQPARYGGFACPSNTREQRICNAGPCHQGGDCVVTHWSQWGACSLRCGTGIQARSRQIVQYPSAIGYPCPVLTSTRACNTRPC